MKRHLPLLLFFGLLAADCSAIAQAIPDRPIRVNCDRGASLQEAIDRAQPGARILVSGTCLGQITIAQDRLTIRGDGTAVIDGGKKNAVTIHGAQNISLEELDVRNGKNGIVARSGAHFNLANVAVHDNSAIGILLEWNSSAMLRGGSSRHNGLNGIDLEGTSSLIMKGRYSVEANSVFGININSSSSLTFTQARVTVSQNTLGIQIATSSGAFITDSATSIDVSGNATTGLTIVSGGHMVAFGGTITAQGNGVHGISVDSKAGFDLDAAALVESHDNSGDGVHLEETSVMTMFNTPAFSGAPGTTTLKSFNNGGNGISILTGSNLTLIHQATINSSANQGAGIAADNGSGLTLIKSMITGNKKKDVLLTFGSRADITGSSIGAISCDATVLLRGDTGATCPH
jgi:Right handed beta helix region